MTTSDPFLDHYYSLNPAEFRYIECLELRQSVQPDEWVGFTLILRLRSSKPEQKYLHLEFSRVQNLQIGRLEGLVSYFFEIISLRERQLEDINYQVIGGEHNAFSFLCDRFSATIENS